MSTIAQQTAAHFEKPNAGAMVSRRRLHIGARLRCTWTKVRHNKWAQTVAVWISAGMIAVFFGWLAASGF